MDVSMASAAVMGIAPALAIMYLVFRDYTFPRVEEPFFEDKKLFGLFAAGMVVGVILFSAYTWFTWASIFVAIGFAVVQELVKLVILNMPRFQRRLDTAFYGSSLGLGMGSTLGFGMAYYLLSQITDPALTDWAIVFCFCLQQVFLHSATGLTIGEGVVRGYTWEFLAQAVLVNMAFQLLMLPMYMGILPWGYVTTVIALALCVVYCLHVHMRRLPALVSQAVKKYKMSQKDFLRKGK